MFKNIGKHVFEAASISLVIGVTIVHLSFGSERKGITNSTLSPEVYLPIIMKPNLASNFAYNWLASQQEQYNTGLVESYDDAGPLRNVCFTYDQAVATIAFMVKGDITRAQNVLNRLRSLQKSSGSWYTAYSCDTLTVWEWNQHVGPVLWVALAVANYEQRTGDSSYHPMAVDAINWSLQFQQSDDGINGGIGNDGGVLTWASTEHNEDAYATLAHYGFNADASKVKLFLDGPVWDDDQGRWWGGRNDSRDPLDVNSLGVSALGAGFTHNYQVSLDYVMTHHRNVQSNIDGFDFDSDKDDVWLEGTSQMAVAFQVVGRDADSRYFIGEVVKTQDYTGGIPYSMNGTWNGYWAMSTKKSVAATGWLIFAIEGVNPLLP